MHHDSYKVIFDITEAGYRQWKFAASGLFIVAVGIALIIYRRFYPYKTKSFRRIFPYFFTGFGIIWTFFAFAATYSDYTNLRNAIKEGQFQIVEGRITDFVPMPEEGHAMEHFVVNGHYYEYSDFAVSAGFNNTQSHGGPLREGVYVRIWDVNGEIARLEIEE